MQFSDLCVLQISILMLFLPLPNKIRLKSSQVANQINDLIFLWGIRYLLGRLQIRKNIFLIMNLGHFKSLFALFMQKSCLQQEKSKSVITFIIWTLCNLYCTANKVHSKLDNDFIVILIFWWAFIDFYSIWKTTFWWHIVTVHKTTEGDK